MRLERALARIGEWLSARDVLCGVECAPGADGTPVLYRTIAWIMGEDEIIALAMGLEQDRAKARQSSVIPEDVVAHPGSTMVKWGPSARLGMVNRSGRWEDTECILPENLSDVSVRKRTEKPGYLGAGSPEVIRSFDMGETRTRRVKVSRRRDEKIVEAIRAPDTVWRTQTVSQGAPNVACRHGHVFRVLPTATQKRCIRRLLPLALQGKASHAMCSELATTLQALSILR